MSALWEGNGLRMQAYAADYRLRLFSDSTFFARDPVNGDEIEQTEAPKLRCRSPQLDPPGKV